jgi:hypothetical protein
MYCDGDVDRLLNRVHHLDQTLPLQSMRVQLPFENTSGEFELFNRGVTDLAPELVGWYGAPGIDPNGTTTLFLVGRSFSVNGMQVIAGGRAINDFSMLSRQVLRVTIPYGSQFIIDDSGNELVDGQAATAYGVTDLLSDSSVAVCDRLNARPQSVRRQTVVYLPFAANSEWH